MASPPASAGPIAAANHGASQAGVKYLSRALTVLLLIGLLVYALLFCLYAARLFAYPFDWEESDGNVILAGKLLEQGRSFYSDPNEYPMLLYTYPPLYAFVVFLATRLFGDYVGIARLVSCALTVAILFLVYHVVRREGARNCQSRSGTVRGSKPHRVQNPRADGGFADVSLCRRDEVDGLRAAPTRFSPCCC